MFAQGVRCATVIPFAPYGSAIIAWTQKKTDIPVASKARNHKADILQACGLSLPPRVCSRPELASCLGTRFPTNRSAVPMLRELGQR